MTKLRPAIKVAASRDAVYHAFTDIAGLADWQLASIQGMQIAMAREREMLMRQRVADLAKANNRIAANTG